MATRARPLLGLLILAAAQAGCGGGGSQTLEARFKAQCMAGANAPADTCARLQIALLSDGDLERLDSAVGACELPDEISSAVLSKRQQACDQALQHFRTHRHTEEARDFYEIDTILLPVLWDGATAAARLFEASPTSERRAALTQRLNEYRARYRKIRAWLDDGEKLRGRGVAQRPGSI